MSLNRLKNHLTYLVGPMDHSPDNGRGWREKISKFYWDLGIGVLSPTNKPSNEGSEAQDEIAGLMDKKACGQYHQLAKAMNTIVSVDLHYVDLSNFITVYLDTTIHTCGTYSEITYAALEKKPVIVCCKQGKQCIPNWLYGLGLRHEMFFGSWADVHNYIRYINSHPIIDTLNKWRFIDYEVVYGKTPGI